MWSLCETGELALKYERIFGMIVIAFKNIQ